MSKKIHCVFHQEDTPSMMLYSNGYFCFGCGAGGPLKDLTGVELPPREELEPEDPEDLKASFEYIDALPTQTIRGLEFPADQEGYYICWPDKRYYKKRFFNPGRSKYLGARGHKRPMFWANRVGNKTLAIVEGEINALSIAKAFPEYDVCSPGGVGDFTENKIKSMLHNYTIYCNIVVIADADKPGAEAIINALGVFWTNKMFAIGVPMEPDANQILETSGSEQLRQEVEKRSGRAMANRSS